MVELDSSTVPMHVETPGVALLEWRHPRDMASLLLHHALEQISRAYPDVRVGGVDVAKERALATGWHIEALPTLMAYRDGILVFSRVGPLSPSAVEELVAALWSLNMDEVRKRVDGSGGRVLITFSHDREPALEVDPSLVAGAGSAGRRH